ncbi:MAG: DUF1656 domain-containing protein [Pseudomonas sp.]|nr:DUF1656 domain-containing protein [Pseudomonas sp.]
MTGHLNVYGVYVPVLLVAMLAAYGVKSVFAAALRRLGFYRWVWHSPLFNLALYILVLGALFNLVPRM